MSSSSTKDTTSQGQQPVQSDLASQKSTVDDPKKQLAAEKKKLKVMKQALKDERLQKEAIEKELKQSQDRIEQVRSQLAEKDAKYLQLYDENMKLQEALIRESKSSSGQGSLATPKGGGKQQNLLKKALGEDGSEQPNEALVAKCKAQEETIIKKEDEISKLLERLQQADLQM